MDEEDSNEEDSKEEDSNQFRLEPIDMSYNNIKVTTPQNYQLIYPKGYAPTYSYLFTSWTVLPDGSTIALIQSDESEDKK